MVENNIEWKIMFKLTKQAFIALWSFSGSFQNISL